MLTDDDLLARGAEAEQARPYIHKVVKDAKELIYDRIMALAPDQTMLFTVYRSQALCLDDVVSTVEADIENGKDALDRIQGILVEQKGGIL